MDKYKIGEDMVSHYGALFFPMRKTLFNKIDSILNAHPQDIPMWKWEEYLHSRDSCVYCAILATDASPETIKMNAIDKAAKRLSHNKTFFLPILFSPDKEISGYLSEDVSKHFVSFINLRDFIETSNTYFQNHPEKTEFPFAGTYLENALLEEILYRDESHPFSTVLTEDYNSYRIIEYYFDTTELMDIIGDLENHNENVLTALVNNPRVPDDIKEQAFMLGIDISKINGNQSPEIIKQVYSSAISSCEKSEVNSYVRKEGTKCLCQLAYKGILPESCQLDLLNKINAGEVILPAMLPSVMLSKTPYETVINKAIDISKKNNNKNHTIRESCFSNTKVSSDYVITTINEIVDNILTSNCKMTQMQENMLLAAIKHQNLPSSLFEKIISVFEDKSLIFQNFGLNPNATDEILNKIIADDSMDDRIKASALFNIKSKTGFNTDNRRQMLTTLKGIVDICSAGDSYVPKTIRSELQFLPKYNDPQNKFLKQMLQNIKEENKMPFVQYATRYIKTLDKKDLLESTQDLFLYPSISQMTNKQLFANKEYILEQIFCQCPSKIDIYGKTKMDRTWDMKKTNFYDIYAAYESMVLFAEPYNDIVNELKDRQRQATVQKQIKMKQSNQIDNFSI